MMIVDQVLDALDRGETYQTSTGVWPLLEMALRQATRSMLIDVEIENRVVTLRKVNRRLGLDARDAGRR